MKNKLRSIAILLIATISLNTLAFAAPTKPSVNAISAILVEATTGKVLYEKNVDKTMFPASMTKILTALVALENFKPDDVIVVGNEINEVSLDSSKAGHIKGESITVENLIRGLIIPSGNDTAVIIATAVAKKVSGDNTLNPAECEKFFADLMNKKAQSLGCKNSSFVNPHGYQNDNHYTTASDMSKIAAEALKNSVIKEICGEKKFNGNGMGDKDKTGIITKDYDWSSHNLLITAGEYSYPYATGMKTGFTNEAGDCVTASAEKDGVQLIAVIFNSEDPGRWADAATLFDYGFANYSFNQLGKKDDIIGEIPLHNHKSEDGDNLSLIVKNDINLFLENEVAQKIEKEINITNEAYIYKSKDENDKQIKINAPIEADTELGTVIYKNGDNVIAEEKIYAGRSVEKASFIEKIGHGIKNFFGNLFSLKGIIIALAVIAIIIILIIVIRIFINRKRRPRSRYKIKSNRRRRF